MIEGLEARSLLSVAALNSVVAQPAIDMAPLASSSAPTGLSPSQISQAYGINPISLPGGVTGDGSGQTIAIVVAYGDPNIQTDLQKFSSQYGLPAPTSTNFKMAYPNGSPFGTDSGWALETALDVEWAHAVAPKANILLVVARSDNMSDLMSAVNYARSASGVSVVSMSWGGDVGSAETSYDRYFTTPAGHNPVTFVAASGDSGAVVGSNYPADSPNVVSVGGTTLRVGSTGTYQSETAWNGSGGGYSYNETEPSYQRNVQSTGQRTVPDVAYVANPSTGISVYDSFQSSSSKSWYTVGGTSAGTPQWAGLVAIADQGLTLAGKATLGSTQTLSLLYQLPASAFHDITSGNNGQFSASVGYDLVTGLGTPKAQNVINGLLGVAGTSTGTGTTGTGTGTGTGTTGTGTTGTIGQNNPISQPPPAPIFQPPSPPRYPWWWGRRVDTTETVAAMTTTTAASSSAVLDVAVPVQTAAPTVAATVPPGPAAVFSIDLGTPHAAVSTSTVNPVPLYATNLIDRTDVIAVADESAPVTLAPDDTPVAPDSSPAAPADVPVWPPAIPAQMWDKLLQGVEPWVASAPRARAGGDRGDGPRQRGRGTRSGQRLGTRSGRLHRGLAARPGGRRPAVGPSRKIVADRRRGRPVPLPRGFSRPGACPRDDGCRSVTRSQPGDACCRPTRANRLRECTRRVLSV